jgi:hypothetical protein
MTRFVRTTRLRYFVQAATAAAAAFGLTATALSATRSQRQRTDVAAFQRLDSLRQSGDQLVLVYIGSARCRWCRDPELPIHVRAVMDSLERRATRTGARFGTIGVAVDVLKHEGLAHLERIADFDQVSAGNSWLNSSAIDLIWERYGSPASTPQLLVLRRSVLRERGIGMEATYSVADQTLLARKVGVYEIANWVKGGVPLVRER